MRLQIEVVVAPNCNCARKYTDRIRSTSWPNYSGEKFWKCDLGHSARKRSVLALKDMITGMDNVADITSQIVIVAGIAKGLLWTPVPTSREGQMRGCR